MNSEESELKGTGTAEDPYQIGSAAALAEFRDKVNGGERDADAVLIANIDLSEICSDEKDTSWTPIGNAQTVSGKTYKGSFDGQGHSVKNLYIAGSETAGLFGYIGSSGTVQNLRVSGSITNTSNTTTGGGVAAINDGRIENCCSSVTIIATATGNNAVTVGGVVGQNYGSVTNCCNSSSVSGTGSGSGPIFVGGVVGQNFNGSLTVDRYATEGDKVTIEVAPDEAYLLDELVVTAGGKDVELTDNHDGTYTFTMPSADVKITATFAEDPDWTEPEEPATDVSEIFIDIAANAWYKDAVQYAYDNGLMTGVSANEFAPEQTTTRAMIVSMLARLEGVESAESAGFSDVAANDWYATAVNWAASVGVVNGYEDGTFKPITREQLAAILMNYAAYKGEDVSARADLSSYTNQPSTWAEEAMQWAVAEELITGVTNDELQPQSSATRAQVAAILQRFLAE